MVRFGLRGYAGRMRPLSRAAAVLCLLAASAAAQVCPLGPTKTKIVSCRPGVSMPDCRRLVERVGCAVKRELPSIRAVVIEIPESRVSAADATLKKAPQVEFSEDDE